jgi:hypothetical protein
LRPLGPRLLALLALLAAAATADSADSKVPENLVLDLRLYEARSSQPDYDAMEGLHFFIDTDGRGVTEQQWLATILRKTPDAVLATLASETLPAGGGSARFSLSKRTRSFDVRVDLKEFSEKEAFTAKAEISLLTGDERLRSFGSEIQLRLGQTYVWGSRDLEFSASDYLSHFRDFESTEDRGELYQSLRRYTFFLVLAATPRIAEAAAEEPVVVDRNDSVSLGSLESPLGVRVDGKVEVELTLDGEGAPTEARVVRSSVPELNALVLGAAPSWRFPEAAGKKARLTLDLHARPRAPL